MISTEHTDVSGLDWKKFCNDAPDCLELAPFGAGVALRNSTLPEHLVTGTKTEFAALIAAAKNGLLDAYVN